MNNPTWGDTVQIKETAGAEMHPGSLAAVCGMRLVETAEQAKQFGCPVGTTIYLVELGTGISFEISETYLERTDDVLE